MDAAYACFLLLGTGALLPWNCLITAADYWESRFPGQHTDRLLTVFYLPSNLLMVSAMVATHGAVRPRLRITAGLLGFTLALAAVTLMDSAPPSGRALGALLALVAACGACDGMASGALYGEAAVLAPRYTQALAAGNSVSGIAVTLLRAATKATLPATASGLRRSANLYFNLAAAACLACTLLYALVLPRLAVVRRRRHAALAAALHSYDELPCVDEDSSTSGGGCCGPRASQHNKLPSPARPRRHGGRLQDGVQRGSIDLELSAEDHGSPYPPASPEQQHLLPGQVEAAPLLQPPPQQQQAGGGAPTARAVLRCIWPLALANTLTFLVTLSIFPGVLAEDLHSPALGSWYPVALIGAYNCADWAGKSLPGWSPLRLRDERAILAATLGRALFIPAFRLAVVQQAAPPAVFALAMALGCSNGYSCACAMMRAPAVAPPGAAGLAGNLMVLFLVLGLCAGAAASFLWLLLPLS